VKSELLGWRPGLEGLRGVAVLAVMLYHFEATKHSFPGGSLGVDLFFVLSGFLITTLLLEERWRSGAISLAAFYQRRARRLLPALVAFLTVLTAVTLLARQPGADRLLVTDAGGLFYVFNWLDDFGVATTPAAGHLWSLSVEEQFYLFWPLAAILALRTRAGPGALLGLSLLVFLLAASLPAWSGRGYGEMYSGTDFRAQQLMAGAILAQLRFSGVVTPAVVSRPSFRLALAIAVGVFALFVLRMESRVDFLYSGMYTVTALAGAVMVCAALYQPPRLLANGVIRYVGTRSYALYLWHHAIDFWLRDLEAAPGLVLSFVLSFAAAELSWRLVEVPGKNARLRRIREWFTGSRSGRVKPATPAVVQPASEPHHLA
jgi:peptidoglycan/LPS O-acetylase OafA/YrhL